MKSLIITAIAAAAMAPAIASARPVKTIGEQNQVVVSYADLNLNTANGQSRLKGRIMSAAQSVCGAQPDNKDLRGTIQYNACVRTSIGAATAAVPAPSMVADTYGHNG